VVASLVRRCTMAEGTFELAESSMASGTKGPEQSTCAIAVMAKASIAGTTKTRLIPPLTPDEAAQLNTQFLRDAADNILTAANSANISGWMAYAPAGSEQFFRSHLPADIGLIETVAPTLGECLHKTAADLFGAGHGAVCLLNSDSPTLPPAYLVTAATALAAPGDRVVIGPAVDGGYYLIGMKCLHAGLFEGIAWSTDQVLSQTMAKAGRLGLDVVSLPSWYDVDDLESLRTLAGEVLGGVPFEEGRRPARASWTRRQLLSLAASSRLQDYIHFPHVAGTRS
jgi:uncharacterized protein